MGAQQRDELDGSSALLTSSSGTSSAEAKARLWQRRARQPREENSRKWPRFDELPTETLLEIMSHVPVRDLSSLSCLCRRLNNLIDMKARKRYHRIYLRTPHDLHLAYDLLMEALRSPGLRLYVREIELQRPDWVPPLDPEFELDMDWDHEDVAVIRKSIRAKGAIWSVSMENAIVSAVMQCRAPNVRLVDKNGNLGSGFDAVAAIFMLVSPKLDTLRIADFGFPVQQLLQRVNARPFKSMKRQTSYLRNLRTVELLAPKGVQPYRSLEYYDHDLLRSLRRFHRIPSIERVGITSMCTNEQFGRKLWHVTPRSSNVRKIHIKHSYIDHKILIQAIRHSKFLEELVCTTGGHVEPNWIANPINERELAVELWPHRYTLRRLDLDLDRNDKTNAAFGLSFLNTNHNIVYSNPIDSDEDDEAPDLANDPKNEMTRLFPVPIHSARMWPLAQYTALTHLSIGICFLLGFPFNRGPMSEFNCRLVDFLPPNLEYLCIRGYSPDCGDWYRRRITEFMAQKAERFPNLVVEGVDEEIPSSQHGIFDFQSM